MTPKHYSWPYKNLDERVFYDLIFKALVYFPYEEVYQMFRDMFVFSRLNPEE